MKKKVHVICTRTGDPRGVARSIARDGLVLSQLLGMGVSERFVHFILPIATPYYRRG